MALIFGERIIKQRGPLEDKAFINEFFWKIVPNDAWAGKPCYIIGGGPSLEKQWDWLLPRLKGKLTIGINRAHEKFNPTIIFGTDPKFINWVQMGKYGEPARVNWEKTTAYKVWLCASNYSLPKDVYILKCFGGYHKALQSFPLVMEEGIGHGNNSGYGALNLAACLGANPIYLLGYDMKRDGNKTNWHDGHPEQKGEHVPACFKKHFISAVKELNKKGIEVINLNPDSALGCFPKAEMSTGFYSLTKHEPAISTADDEFSDIIVDNAWKGTQNAGRAKKMTESITLITPTGDRPLAFALCQNWMRKQTLQPDQWIVVDDGKIPMKPFISMEYVRRKPRFSDPKRTLIENLKIAIPLIKGSKIVIIEDDEYYAPKYIEEMSSRLDHHKVVGIGKSKYYHLISAGYFRVGNMNHASFAQTAFRNSFLSEFKELLNDSSNYVDLRLWRKANESKDGFLFVDNIPLYLGIKGMPGRHGIGGGHDANHRIYRHRSHDKTRDILKKWIPDNDDYNIYMDIINGKLTEKNCKSKMNISDNVKNVTGITVCYNTKDLMERAYNSVRKFHPNMPIIIIDGSGPRDPCAFYVKSLVSDKTKVISLRKNIGHGWGMHMGIGLVKTEYALIFDSDIEILKSPVSQMLEMMKANTFGVGCLSKIGFDGVNYGKRLQHKETDYVLYLHPFFQLININNYKKYHRYVHHGAPCYLTMIDIHKRRLSQKILVEFPDLKTYVKHYHRGTRNYRASHGMTSIEKNWETKCKTIAFITRVHPKRPNMLKTCIDSIKKQTSDDYIHILSRDDKTENGYGRFMANKSFAKISPINAQYVMTIDDDDMLIDPDFVNIFKEIINKNNPEIVFFKAYISNHLYPRPDFWIKAPVIARIGSLCFAVRLDIWKKYVYEFGKKVCGDYYFISACYKNTKNHVWLDRIVAKTQKKAGEGLGEHKHA